MWGTHARTAARAGATVVTAQELFTVFTAVYVENCADGDKSESSTYFQTTPPQGTGQGPTCHRCSIPLLLLQAILQMKCHAVKPLKRGVMLTQHIDHMKQACKWRSQWGFAR
eukprot:TRINITY_DN14912_c0_g1_i1.p1 TRINITY_DN14912_c0_g1~~TRINITY_DN14912_c0_g1_i1.p1  ORF type:complete len:112 (+),score=16.90 TRINITY_DN14912_c0_g1_i1:252-587(+)